MIGILKKMSEVKDGVYEFLPAGNYILEISGIKDKESQNGDPMIEVQFRVCEGEYEDRKVWDHIILSENPDSPGWNIRWRCKMFLKAIGEEHNGDTFSWDSENWMWKKCN